MLNEQQYSLLTITDYARDMAIYGRTDPTGVAIAHNIATDDIPDVQDTAVYKAEYARVEKQLASSHGAIRIKAQNMLSSSVDTIGEIANARYQPGSTRLKAIEMIQKLAGVEDDSANVGKGVVLHLDFGGLLPSIETAVQELKDVELDRVVLKKGWSLDSE